jgi:hypothetical protein
MSDGDPVLEPLTSALLPDPAERSYSPGSFMVTTEHYTIMAKHLKLTTTQRVTLEGTARLVILG